MDKKLLETLRKAGCGELLDTLKKEGCDPPAPSILVALVDCLEEVLEKSPDDHRRPDALDGLRGLLSVEGTDRERIHIILNKHEPRSPDLDPLISTPEHPDHEGWAKLLKELSKSNGTHREINTFLDRLVKVFGNELEQCDDKEEFYQKHQSFFQEVLSTFKDRLTISRHNALLTGWVTEAKLVKLRKFRTAVEKGAKPEVCEQLNDQAMEILKDAPENEEARAALSLVTKCRAWRKQFDRCLELIAGFKPQKDWYYPWLKGKKVSYIHDLTPPELQEMRQGLDKYGTDPDAKKYDSTLLTLKEGLLQVLVPDDSSKPVDVLLAMRSARAAWLPEVGDWPESKEWDAAEERYNKKLKSWAAELLQKLRGKCAGLKQLETVLTDSRIKSLEPFELTEASDFQNEISSMVELYSNIETWRNKDLSALVSSKRVDEAADALKKREGSWCGTECFNALDAELKKLRDEILTLEKARGHYDSGEFEEAVRLLADSTLPAAKDLRIKAERLAADKCYTDRLRSQGYGTLREEELVGASPTVKDLHKRLQRGHNFSVQFHKKAEPTQWGSEFITAARKILDLLCMQIPDDAELAALEYAEFKARRDGLSGELKERANRFLKDNANSIHRAKEFVAMAREILELLLMQRPQAAEPAESEDTAFKECRSILLKKLDDLMDCFLQRLKKQVQFFPLPEESSLKKLETELREFLDICDSPAMEKTEAEVWRNDVEGVSLILEVQRALCEADRTKAHKLLGEAREKEKLDKHELAELRASLEVHQLSSSNDAQNKEKWLKLYCEWPVLFEHDEYQKRYLKYLKQSPGIEPEAHCELLEHHFPEEQTLRVLVAAFANPSKLRGLTTPLEEKNAPLVKNLLPELVKDTKNYDVVKNLWELNKSKSMQRKVWREKESPVEKMGRQIRAELKGVDAELRDPQIPIRDLKDRIDLYLSWGFKCGDAQRKVDYAEQLKHTVADWDRQDPWADKLQELGDTERELLESFPLDIQKARKWRPAVDTRRKGIKAWNNLKEAWSDFNSEFSTQSTEFDTNPKSWDWFKHKLEVWDQELKSAIGDIDWSLPGASESAKWLNLREQWEESTEGQIWRKLSKPEPENLEALRAVFEKIANQIGRFSELHEYVLSDQNEENLKQLRDLEPLSRPVEAIKRQLTDPSACIKVGRPYKDFIDRQKKT